MSTFLLRRTGHDPSLLGRPLARRARLWLLAPACVAAMSAAAPAHAAAPPNDNYLASLIMRDSSGGFPREWTGTVDTSEATTQADLFDPNRDGDPLGGGPPEPLACGSATLGRTVWWDFSPPITGAVELRATGFDTALAVYEFDRRTSKIIRQVACAATPGAPETLTLPETAKAGHSYTVQLGGQLSADGSIPAGPATLGFSFFPDRDDDGILDLLPDRCPDLAGVSAYGGCPPTLKPTISYTYRSAGRGVTLDGVKVADVPAGAKVRLRAGGYTAKRTSTGGALEFPKVAGRRLPSGAVLEVRASLDAGTGIYAHGAIGADVRFRVSGGRLGGRTSRCLVPGQRTPRKSCKRVAR